MIQQLSVGNRFHSLTLDDPQQETKSSTKQLPPTDPILGPENLLKTGFAQKGLPSGASGRHQIQNAEGSVLDPCAKQMLFRKGPKSGPSWIESGGVQGNPKF